MSQVMLEMLHSFILSSKNGVKGPKEEKVEEEANKPKKVPLSLEELLAKKKAEEEALSKVMTQLPGFYPLLQYCSHP